MAARSTPERGCRAHPWRASSSRRELRHRGDKFFAVHFNLLFGHRPCELPAVHDRERVFAGWSDRGIPRASVRRLGQLRAAIQWFRASESVRLRAVRCRQREGQFALDRRSPETRLARGERPSLLCGPAVTCYRCGGRRRASHWRQRRNIHCASLPSPSRPEQPPRCRSASPWREDNVSASPKRRSPTTAARSSVYGRWRDFAGCPVPRRVRGFLASRAGLTDPVECSPLPCGACHATNGAMHHAGCIAKLRRQATR